MNFYRLKHNTTLHSFGDDIGEVPILLSTLSDCQSSYVKLVGGHLIDIESETEINTKQPYFVFTDDFYFSLPFLKNCVSTAKSCQTNLQFCVDDNEFNERYVLPHKNDSETHHVFDFYYKVNDGKTELNLLNNLILSTIIFYLRK